jgi:hypothetical protein
MLIQSRTSEAHNFSLVSSRSIKMQGRPRDSSRSSHWPSDSVNMEACAHRPKPEKDGEMIFRGEQSPVVRISMSLMLQAARSGARCTRSTVPFDMSIDGSMTECRSRSASKPKHLALPWSLSRQTGSGSARMWYVGTCVLRDIADTSGHLLL